MWMSIIGSLVIALVMTCAVARAIAPCLNEEKRDHKYLALGMMSGILSIPLGVLISSLLLMLLAPAIRTTPATQGDPGHPLALTMSTVLINLVPLVIFVTLLALGLRLVPNAM